MKKIKPIWKSEKKSDVGACSTGRKAHMKKIMPIWKSEKKNDVWACRKCATRSSTH